MLDLPKIHNSQHERNQTQIDDPANNNDLMNDMSVKYKKRHVSGIKRNN